MSNDKQKGKKQNAGRGSSEDPAAPSVNASPSKFEKSLAPAEVALISNPIPSFSVYQWVPRGVCNLNRKNKLSSLPFWFPNDTMRMHQFRLVLLRGVVREDAEEDDPVAVFLEYLPPPTAQPQEHPKGCRISMRLLNRHLMDEGSRAGDAIAEVTASIDGSDRQVAFREFILPKHLGDPHFVGDDGATVILEVSIMTGVNVVAETVAKSAGSLWSAFSNISSSVSSLVKEAVQSTAIRLDQREECRDAAPTTDSLGAAKQSAAAFFSSLLETVSSSSAPEVRSSRELPWDTAPERWSGRGELWRQLVAVHLVEDENTFLVGPSRGIMANEQLLLTQYGLNHRSITAAASLFDYDRDVHEGLLSLPALRSQRYRLVPQRIVDEAFWSNFMWKIASLSTCGTHEQAQLLLSIINAPMPCKHGSGADAAGPASTENGTFSSWVQSVSSSVRSGIKGLSPVTDVEVTSAVREAVESAAALEDYLLDEVNEASEGDHHVLMGAAVSSCQRHVECLQRLRLRNIPVEVVDSLDAAIATLHKSLQRYAALSARNGRRSPPVGEPAEEVDGEEAPSHEEAPHRHFDADVAAATMAEDDDAVEQVEQHSALIVDPSIGAEPAVAEEDNVPAEKVDDGPQMVDVAEVRQMSPLLQGDEAKDEDSTPPSSRKSPTSTQHESSFERLPSIDDIKTPAPRGESVPAGGSSSSRRLEFAPMPWEEDDA